MVREEFENVLDVLDELSNDSSISKNLKKILETVTTILKHGGDIRIQSNKALQELENIADDSTMDPYMRTQIWNIISMLEKISIS